MFWGEDYFFVIYKKTRFFSLTSDTFAQSLTLSEIRK